MNSVRVGVVEGGAPFIEARLTAGSVRGGVEGGTLIDPRFMLESVRVGVAGAPCLFAAASGRVGVPTRFDQIASLTPFAIGLRFQKEDLGSWIPLEVFVFGLSHGEGVSGEAEVLAPLTHVKEASSSLEGSGETPFALGESLGTTWAAA